MLENLTKTSKFLIGLAVQVLVILGIVIVKLAVLSGGTEIALRLVPVDPRDMLRGDYMTIRYDISSVPGYYFSYSPIQDGDTVYVPLIKNGLFWTATSGVSKNLPVQKNTDYVYIKGTVINGGAEASAFSGNNNFNRFNNTGNVSLKYNIEQYYVPEGLGNTWVATRCSSWSGDRCLDTGSDDTYAVVAVGDNGASVLKKLIHNGKPWP